MTIAFRHALIPEHHFHGIVTTVRHVLHSPYDPCRASTPASYFGLVAALIAFAASAQSSITAKTVEVQSGALRLKAYLRVPSGSGPFPAVLYNHGRSDSAEYHWRAGNLTLSAAAQAIGPVFAKHGYVFLFPFRRGEGPSAGQGDFIGDLLEREENANGVAAKKHLQVILLSTDHLDDSLASLAFLRGLPQVDIHRIALIGHSFGGQLTILEAARDHSVRAAVTFGRQVLQRGPQFSVLKHPALGRGCVPVP